MPSEKLENINYEVSHRNVKYPRIEFKTGKLLIIVPEGEEDERRILDKYKFWIEEKYAQIREAEEASKNKKLGSRSDEELKSFVNKLIEQYSLEIGVPPPKNTYFRIMKSKWASCSTNQNLTVNSLVKYLPTTVVEYIIYHEMMHLIERRHNMYFWEKISKKFPEYENFEKELFEYWFIIQTSIESK